MLGVVQSKLASSVRRDRYCLSGGGLARSQPPAACVHLLTYRRAGRRRLSSGNVIPSQPSGGQRSRLASPARTTRAACACEATAKQELPCPGPRAGPGRAGQGADGVGVLRVRLVVLLSVAPHKVCPARLGRGRCVAITTKRAGRGGALSAAARGASAGVHLASPRRRNRTARTRPSGVPAPAQSPISARPQQSPAAGPPGCVSAVARFTA